MQAASVLLTVGATHALLPPSRILRVLLALVRGIMSVTPPSDVRACNHHQASALFAFVAASIMQVLLPLVDMNSPKHKFSDCLHITQQITCCRISLMLASQKIKTENHSRGGQTILPDVCLRLLQWVKLLPCSFGGV